MTFALVGLSGCGGTDCSDSFDTKAWRSASIDSDQRRDLAHQVADCHLLENATRRRVIALLGRAERDKEEQSPSEYKRQWYYPVGDTNDLLGPADAQDLAVFFDARGRVTHVEVSP